MKKLWLLITLILMFSKGLFAQVGISTDNSTPHPTAILDLKSTTKGVLLPRLTQTQISTISNPANGLLVFFTTNGKIYIYVNSAGQWKEVAYGSEIIQPFFLCGDPITISHQAGDIAPVDKTVTYGTINNIPGEPTKCWITSNLGADHQAITVDDATEASAGWYWVFNRKQGYKQDGSTITPLWTPPNIWEDYDWTPSSDPCRIELGIDWRIPTNTEWTNVDATEGWEDWTGPWNSSLKLHAAGQVGGVNGNIGNRGELGFYWSSTQSTWMNGWGLYFGISNSSITQFGKFGAMSIRCLREN